MVRMSVDIHRQLEFQLGECSGSFVASRTFTKYLFALLEEGVRFIVFYQIVLVCSPIIFTPIAIAVKLSSRVQYF